MPILTCPLCNAHAVDARDNTPLDWTVCPKCGVILAPALGQYGLYLRECEPEEFLAMLHSPREYGMLLLLQDEIRAQAHVSGKGVKGTGGAGIHRNTGSGS